MFQKTLFGQLFQKLNLLNDYGFSAQAGEIGADCKGSGWNEETNFTRYKGQDLIWTNIVLLFIWHTTAVVCIFRYSSHVNWSLILWCFIIGIAGGLGVTGGAHRLWAHKSYKAKLPFQIFVLFLFTMAGQNSVYDWVRDHRVHHKYSDTDADPHNASRGFFYSHVGWLMVRKRPEVRDKGRTIDMTDIENDPLLAFQRKHFIILKILIAFVLPSMIPPLLWGENWVHSILVICFVRYVFSLNFTWSVNSAAHLWGNKPYAGNIMPSENKVVSIITSGEGWHNYHHVFPWDYKAKELGPASFELTTKMINLGAKLGLCYDLKEASKDLVERVALKHGDGTWHEYSGPFFDNDVIKN